MGRRDMGKGKSNATARPDVANAAEAPDATPAQAGDDATLVTSMLRQAWLGLAFWMTFGLLLEGLIGYRIPDYLNDPQRRELLRLAHAHGAVLSIVLLASALGIGYGRTRPVRATVAALRIGVVVMPLAFLAAGLWHYANDPGLAIWLAPPAALLIVFGVIGLALGTRAPRGDASSR
ncbi:MAG: hypothetical protein U1F54_06625 [Burkholderiales bacterium]